jgi:hypothetical protein
VSILAEFKEKEARFKKAMSFMDSSASEAEKDKWQPEFEKLLGELNALHNQLTAGKEGEGR